MSDVEIVVGIRSDTSGGRTIKRNLDEIASSGDKAVNATQRLEKQLRAASLAGEVFGRVFGAFLATASISRFSQMADGYRLLEARINSITNSTKETTRVMGELRKITDQTGSSMEASVSILQRLSFARNEIKATNDEMLVFTETVTKMGIMSGASADALKNGLTQLGQALSSDIMRAEEFNSVMENTPSIGKAIADQFGVTTGQLRLLVVNGQVLRDDIFAAILNQAKQTREEFEKFPATAERGAAQMLGRFTQLADEINRSVNGTNNLGVLMRLVGDGAKHVYNGIATTFEYVVAGIMELFNLIVRGINLAIDGMNKLKAITPGADKTPFERMNAVSVGSIFKEAGTNTIERTNRLFAESTQDIEVATRNISKNYADIAAGLGNATKLTKEQKEALKEQKRIQDQLTDAIKRSRTEEEQLYDTIAEMERLRPFAKTAEQVEAIEKNIANARKELDKLRVAAELKSPVAKAFASLASEIDKGFKDAFKSAFTESDGGFKKMLDGMKNTFKNFLAELAYQAMMRPIMVSVVAAVGGMMGLSGGAVNDVLGNVTGAPGISGGGTGGLNGVSSLFSAGKTLLTGGNMLYSQGAGNLFGNIAQYGAGLFGMDQYAATALGDSVAGWAGTAFSPANMAGGFVGGTAASLLGLSNSNQWVNMGASTIGAIAGQALIPIPGVGAAIGSFLGSALGGLFGGKKPSDKAQWGSIDLSTLETSNVGGMTGKKFSQQNADFRDAVLGEVAGLAKLFQSVGGTTTGKIDLHIGSRDGLRIGNHNGQNFGNNSEAFLSAVMQRVVDSTTGLSETFQTILDRVGVSDTVKLAEAFNFGQMYEAFIKSAEPVDVLQEALDALNAQLEQLQKTATELGLPTDKLTEAYNIQKEKILDSIKAQMAGFSNLESMTKAFNDFLNGQALGSNSSLSPMQKLELAQGNFGSLLEKAQGGDYSVTQDLLKAANELLNIGRGVYASSVSFAGLESFVRSSIKEVARAAGVPGYATGTDNASSGFAMVGERGRELVQMSGGEKVWTAGETASIMAVSGNMATDIARTNAQILHINQDLLDEIRALRLENQRMRKQMERIGNRMAVAKVAS